MSKSRGNVVNPDPYFESHGVDTLRMYLMFIGPFDRGGEWTDKGILGIRRFLGRVWDLCLRHPRELESSDTPADARRRLNQTIRQVTAHVGQLRYNTAIAALMAYANTLQPREHVRQQELCALLLMLAPFAPHITEELWCGLGMPFSIHQQAFPVDE